MRRAVCFAIDARCEREKAQKLLRPAAAWLVFALVAVEDRKRKSKENEKVKEKLKARQGKARHFIAAQFLKLLHTREFKRVYMNDGEADR